MNSLYATLFRSLHQRRPFGLNRLVTAEVTRAVGLSAAIPLALGHWQYVGNTAQGRRLNSTKASQLNDKKKPTGKGKKARLTEEEKEEEKRRRKKVVKDFNEFIGERKLKDWRKLCYTIGLEGEFEDATLPGNRPLLIPISFRPHQAIKAVHVNIYDVLETDRIIQAGGESRPQRFTTPQALSKYSIGHRKIYPRNKVIEDQPEHAMLKHIFDPDLEEKLQSKREERLGKKKEAKLKGKEKSQREKEVKQTETGST
ncbi:hypothetical protein GE21DRAFT_2281 [Neurospora crassa]|uniref:Uncharacterized protein n=1 Tax=Neurospora crassa (strain ATCC 24698 / 74-OR23-1A / CBS 708.71 / DSM 1257 / FGSC 987) TaxID=367110 RepID=Q7SGZ9_NEUCR|nr:hypothetical protein NCU03017 [Neurospora crassa OR74A]EAA36167.2 hypothetical protein NCU03017 [Neurospora crassa OR74A]KHE89200.1 hypothetical protein GE21DRAFT_2281 [Neurospora crassa]|eukprot:XP_965403.2 hypothetical protein NCU03017 [Neurospora crassa OR74A]